MGEVRFFDFGSPKALFRSIESNAAILQGQAGKETVRLLYVIFALNHLREWIAPGFKSDETPRHEAEVFYLKIYEYPSFDLLRRVCNMSKHPSGQVSQDTSYGLSIDDWANLDSVQSIDNGPPTGYTVDGRDLLEVVNEVIEYYRRNWFERPSSLGSLV